MLKVAGLHAGYGRVDVLDDVNLDVESGECVALLGPNNAGKTTLLRVISGLVRARTGSIRFQGTEISRLSSAEIVAHGVVQVPEGRHIFGDMSVEENLLVGGARLKRGERYGRLAELVEVFPLLRELGKRRAGSLSGGQQQLVVIARALMAKPVLLAIDEPTLGLSPIAIDEVFAALEQVHLAGTTILLSEQNAELSLELCSRGYIMAQGRIVLEGDNAQLKREALGEVYLS